MCGRLSQGLLGEVVQFLVDAEPVEDDQDVETLLQLLACVTFAWMESVTLEMCRCSRYSRSRSSIAIRVIY